MLIIKEIEDELTIRAFPVVMWSLAIGCFITGAIIAQEIFVALGGSSMIARFYEGKISYAPLYILVLAVFPVGGLVCLYFSPLTVTKIDRQKHLVKIISIGILGKRTEVFGYNSLDGGFRVKSEEDEDKNENLKVYFKLKSGRKVYISNDLYTLGKGKVYDAAMKANEYLSAESRK